jgi:DNA-directed RNA polymerase subunit RPC12/RpoP
MSPNQTSPMEPVVFTAQIECPYCRHVYDRSKLVYNSIIHQYICLDCRQMLLDRSEQRRRTSNAREQELRYHDSRQNEVRETETV